MIGVCAWHLAGLLLLHVCACQLNVRLVVTSAYIPAGTTWQRQAIKAAQSILQLRYGLLTEAQTKKALQRALYNNTNKYGNNFVI